MAESRTLPTGFGELEVLAVGTVLLVEALSGLCLNSLTILSFCKTPELRTPRHLLVLSLALADSGISLNAFIAATSSLLRYLPLPHISHRRWPYGSEGCQAHGFQGFATALASICSSAAIAWGRYHHYCTRSRLDWNTAVSLVFFVWLSSAFWAALPLLGWGHYDYEPLGTCCTLDYSRGDRNFTSFLFTMAFFNFLLPFFITVISYRLMEQKLGKTGRPPVNTVLPARTLLLGWGPYALLYLYAAIADVTSISPKLQMVPALMAKTVPTVNAINYALGSEMVHRGIWQCLSPQKREQD
ncbi:RPE-retinal G protein-coupled receptor isoform X1 [Hippopotamus amphibius kiboko]|uniref:RPE-retinal G protein-coupled receptor isoform X1 n=1 Tax=Hippopotamus amphibius kiboko TaxID=575201 RepID=UPI0025964319|nr:RPE-retinal G protein-coupled receptor isoform X1 [Hippopotamus amphibius kiboko]